MAVFLFLFAITIISICVGSAFLSASAFAVTHRTSLIYFAIFTLAYSLEQTIIFFREYFVQNLPPAENLTQMEDPLFHVVTGAILFQSLWCAVLSFFDKRQHAIHYVPLAIFLSASLLVLTLPTLDDLIRKWLIYGIRQAFFLIIVGYCLFQYRITKSEIDRTRYRRERIPLLIFSLLVIATFIEDTTVMISILPGLSGAETFAAFFYRRNISESLLVLAVVIYAAYQSIRSLKLKAEQRPAIQDKSRQTQLHEILPYFSKKYGLTPREEEILFFIIEDYDNMQIASRLQLALGTIKTHAHNIFHKASVSSREQLIRKFWSER